MPHNNKTLTSSYARWDGKFACGKVLQFNTEAQRDLWTKLHKKNCEICGAIKTMTSKPKELKLIN